MSEVEEKLKKIADKAYKDKVKTEKKAIEQRYLKDKTLLTEILEIVKKRLVYKETGDSWQRNYTVVTEEMLFDDYTTPPKNSWNTGTTMKADGKYFVITVNGHRYSHLGELFKNYKAQVEKSIELNQFERDKLYEKRDTIKQLEKQEPHVKRMLEEYEKTLEEKQEEL